MNDELLAMVEREVLGWDGVSRDPDRRHVALYGFGRRQIGHVHRDGVADLIPFRFVDVIMGACRRYTLLAGNRRRYPTTKGARKALSILSPLPARQDARAPQVRGVP